MATDLHGTDLNRDAMVRQGEKIDDLQSKGKAKKGSVQQWLSPAGKRLDRPGNGYAKNSVEQRSKAKASQ